MIIIECEHIKLQLIAEEDLEMIRDWRNQPHVQEYMDFKETITTADQITWYNNLDKKKNLFFKIIASGEPIGMINLKDIDWENRTAEAGIFVGRKDLIGGITPVFSILVLMKTAFRCFLLKELFAKISKENTNALQLNRQLGYHLHASVNEQFDQFICTKNDFFAPNNSISKLQQLFARNISIQLHIDHFSEWILPYIHVDDRTFQLNHF
jgi:UDP-4-amino-4,6-dideoxy-N-acetyl-beta-L-altrosamine N-acetyltransferase